MTKGPRSAGGLCRLKLHRDADHLSIVSCCTTFPNGSLNNRKISGRPILFMTYSSFGEDLIVHILIVSLVGKARHSAGLDCSIAPYEPENNASTLPSSTVALCVLARVGASTRSFLSTSTCSLYRRYKRRPQYSH